MKDLKVKEIMTKKLEAVKEGATIQDVMKVMSKKKIRSVLVKPRTADDVYGAISIRDVVFKVLAKGADPKKVKAADIMSKPVVCVYPEMKVDQAVKLMQNFNVARVFVTEGKDLLGVVALFDILNAALKK